MSIENKIDEYLAKPALVKNNPLTNKKEELLKKQKAAFKQSPSGLVNPVKEQIEDDHEVGDLEQMPEDSLFSKMEQLVYSLDPDALTDDQLALRDEIMADLEDEFEESTPDEYTGVPLSAESRNRK
jgi:hypothetical protein